MNFRRLSHLAAFAALALCCHSSSFAFEPKSIVEFSDIPLPTLEPTERVTSYWQLNGSLLGLVKRSDDAKYRKFVYLVPRSGLAKAGVKLDTIYFVGEFISPEYHGFASVFSRICGAYRFATVGIVNYERTRIEFNANFTRRDKSCRFTEGDKRELRYVMERYTINEDL